MWTEAHSNKRLAIEKTGRARFNLANLTVFLTLSALLPSARADDKPAELRIGQIRVGKVLFLGNSITLHGPSEKIGWNGNWGMAASAGEKDYVHLLLGRIAEAAHGQPVSMVRNIAEFERQHAGFDIAARLKPEL